MSQRNTALAPPPVSQYQQHDDALVVLARFPDLPGWVLASCLRSRRQVRIEPAPDTAEERIRATAAVTGRSVLITGPRSASPTGTHRVVAAVRDLPSDAAVLSEAAGAAIQMDATVVLVHGVPLSFAERSVGLGDALARGQRVLETAADRLTGDVPGITVDSRLLRVRPHELVGEELDADLLVLGGPRPRIPNRVGLVGCSAIQHAPCHVLLAARPA